MTLDTADNFAVLNKNIRMNPCQMRSSLGYAKFIKFTRKKWRNRDSNNSQSFSNVHDVQKDVLCIDFEA